MKIIFKNYNKYLKEHNLECEEKDNGDNILEQYLDKTNNINNYSSNYESSSSIDSDEEINYDYVPFDKNNNSSDDDDGQNSSHDNKDNNKRKNKKSIKNINKSKKFRNNNKNDEQDNLNRNINFVKYYLEDNEEFNFDFIKEFNKFYVCKNEDAMYKSLNDCEILTEFPLKENNEIFSYFHGVKSHEMYYSKCNHCERNNFKLYLRKKN